MCGCVWSDGFETFGLHIWSSDIKLELINQLLLVRACSPSLYARQLQPWNERAVSSTFKREQKGCRCEDWVTYCLFFYVSHKLKWKGNVNIFLFPLKLQDVWSSLSLSVSLSKNPRSVSVIFADNNDQISLMGFLRYFPISYVIRVEIGNVAKVPWQLRKYPKLHCTNLMCVSGEEIIL